MRDAVVLPCRPRKGLVNMNDEMRKALEAAATSGDQGPGAGTYIVALLIGAVMIAAMWKVFTKAGKPGWAAIIPICRGLP